METGTLDPWLVEAARRRVQDFAAQLRQVDDGAQPVPNLDWTVSDLGQHVAGLPSFWTKQHESGDHFERAEDFAAFSDQQRAHLTETDPQQLAQLVEHEFDRFLHGLSQNTEQRWLYGAMTTTANMCGLVLNETILHGRDLASVTGEVPPTFERREANAAVGAMMVTTPAFIDAERARAEPDGVYHVKFRGGDDYTWTKSGAELLIERGRPPRADAKLNADPATFLLASLGRVSQARAGLSGGMIAYGRRPWRFLGLGNIAIDGV